MSASNSSETTFIANDCGKHMTSSGGRCLVCSPPEQVVYLRCVVEAASYERAEAMMLDAMEDAPAEVYVERGGLETPAYGARF